MVLLGSRHRFVKNLLGWIPFLIFFAIIGYLLITHFKNDVDEYFVRIVLKACLILIGACFASQMLVFVVLGVWRIFNPGFSMAWYLRDLFDFVCAFPFLEIGIFSIGIFFTAPQFIDWLWILMALMTFDTLQYWIRFSKSPLRNLFAFARFHQIEFFQTYKVLGPYLLSAFVNYFFICLKKSLMPLVFILVVMDFRIILPRLVEAGLTLQAFALLMSLMISLHLLSYREDFE